MRAALNDKLTRTLEAVVTSYIYGGRPVGSRYIAGRFDFGLSPASIRNLMARLEDLGYLAKPHTSAGRIPTERGYRFYVDRVMKSTPLKPAESRAIRRAVDPGLPVDRVLERVSRLLESLSQQMCIATTPLPRAGIVTTLETVLVSPNTLFVSAAIGPGSVRTVSVSFDSAEGAQAARSALSKLSRLIVGKRLRRATRSIEGARLPARSAGASLDRLKILLTHLLGDSDCAVHIFGTGNVISGLGDMEDARSLVEILESKRSITRLLLTDQSKKGTSVWIGSENRYEPLRHCSMVRSLYWMGDAAGAIGLIGPLRMEYPRLMALVDYTSQELTMYLAKAGGRNRGARQSKRTRGA
jgi:heat-inducible transcriptional repressor